MNLEQKAIEILTHPENYPGLHKVDRGSIKLQIWQYPAFGVYSSWILYKANRSFGIRRVEWNRFTKAFPLEPITYGSDAILPTIDANSILSKLTAIKLSPFIPVSTIGLDGVIYGIQFESRHILVQLRWWWNLPEEWSSLREWFQEAVDMFEYYLPASTSSLLN